MKRLAIAAAILAVSLAACGGENKVDVSAAPQASAATPPSTAADISTTTAAATTTLPPTTTAARTTTTTVARTTTLPPTTTTTAPKQGTRANPFPGVGLQLSTDGSPEWNAVTLAHLEQVDAAVIHAANQFNDPPPTGQQYMRIYFDGTYAGTDVGRGGEVGYDIKLTGDKHKLYDQAFVSDSHNKLGLLNDAADVTAGGELQGYVYYLVDSDDANVLVAYRLSPSSIAYITPAP
jgi:hypothetical protein